MTARSLTDIMNILTSPDFLKTLSPIRFCKIYLTQGNQYQTGGCFDEIVAKEEKLREEFLIRKLQCAYLSHFDRRRNF